jgi:hypothetical protein
MEKEFLLLCIEIILTPNAHTFWALKTSNMKLDETMQQLSHLQLQYSTKGCDSNYHTRLKLCVILVSQRGKWSHVK